jgi:hypothetical protein
MANASLPSIIIQNAILQGVILSNAVAPTKCTRDNKTKNIRR